MGDGTLLSWLIEVENGFPPFWRLPACVALDLTINSSYPAMSFLTFAF